MTNYNSRTMGQSLVAFASAILLSTACISVALVPVHSARAATVSGAATQAVR